MRIIDLSSDVCSSDLNPIGRAIIGEGFGVAIANGSETVEFDAIRNVISGVERSDAESGRGPSLCRIPIRLILGPLRVGQASAVKERRQPALDPEGATDSIATASRFFLAVARGQIDRPSDV